MKQSIKLLIQEVLSTLVIFGVCIAVTVPIQNYYIKNKCKQMIEKYQQEHKQEIEDAKRTYVIEMQHKIMVEQHLEK